MSDPSQPTLFDLALDTSPAWSSDPRLARTTPAPGAAPGSRATAAPSSSNGAEWSARSALAGHRLRTALACELPAPIGSQRRWRQSATPAGRTWSVLETSGPDIIVRGAGSSLPTPTASTYGSNLGGAAGRVGPVRLSLASAIRAILTPTETANLASPSMAKWPGWWGPLIRCLGTVGFEAPAACLACYAWLMGLSPDWLARSLRQSETLSCPRSPKRSDGR